MIRWVYFLSTYLAPDLFSFLLFTFAIFKTPLSQEFDFQEEFLEGFRLQLYLLLDRLSIIFVGFLINHLIREVEAALEREL